MLLKLEDFNYDTSIDLNIGYYQIQPSKSTSKLCMITPPWEKYCYKRLPMGVANSPDIFQQKIKYLFHGFKCILL